MVRKKKVTFKRPTKESVQQNANKKKGSNNYFNLPNDVELFKFEKKGKYYVNVVPYVVSKATHPDEVEKGTLWWRHPFAVHFDVGVDGKAVICPTSINPKAKCPICEQKKGLNWDEHEETIRKFTPQAWSLINVINVRDSKEGLVYPDNKNEVMLLAISDGKFANILKEEVAMPENEDHALFFDIEDGNGRTLVVRIVEDSFKGKPYLAADRIDFKRRPDMDPDDILNKVINLDKVFNVLKYDDLKSLLNGGEDWEEEEEEEKTSKPSKKTSKKTTKKKVEEEPEEEEDWDDEEEDWEETDSDGEDWEEEEEEEELEEPDEESEEEEDWDDEEEEWEEEEDPADEDDDWEEEEEEEVKPKRGRPKKTATKPAKKTTKKTGGKRGRPKK